MCSQEIEHCLELRLVLLVKIVHDQLFVLTTEEELPNCEKQSAVLYVFETFSLEPQPHARRTSVDWHWPCRLFRRRDRFHFDITSWAGTSEVPSLVMVFKSIETCRPPDTNDSLELSEIKPNSTTSLTPIEQDIAKLEGEERGVFTLGTLHANHGTLRDPDPQGRRTLEAYRPAQRRRVK